MEKDYRKSILVKRNRDREPEDESSNRRVVFEIDPTTGEPLGRTRSGQLYSQGPVIMAQREGAKKYNKDAIILNPVLAAGPTIMIEGIRDPYYSTNDHDFYQSRLEKEQAKYDMYREMDQEELDDRQMRRAISRKINARTLLNANGPKNSKNTVQRSFCFIMGGKTRNKKTNCRKRKTNRRKKIQPKKK